MQLLKMSVPPAFFLNCKAIVMSLITKNLNRIAELDMESKVENQKLLQLQQLLLMSSGNILRNRTIWKFSSSNDWWTNVLPVLPDDLFVAHFRVDRITFNWLVDELRDDMVTQDTTFRDATPVDKKVAVGLKCLASTSDMLTISSLFGIGRSSAHYYFRQFIISMFTKVVPKSIKFPSSEAEFTNIANEFESMWGFPMAIGAIDGSHIPFSPPVDLVTDFQNYKGWRSILAIAICDAKGQALWVKSGMPGRMSDSGAFKQTRLYAGMQQNVIPPTTKIIHGNPVPFTVLGDSGFAMEKWLLKPFTHHNHLSEEMKIFNYRHSRARRSVENLFGRVKQRWRRLLRGLDVTYPNAHKVITVAFALNNICERNNVSLDLTQDEIAENDDWNARYPQPVTTSQADNYTGAHIRNNLMSYFSQQPNPYTG